MAEIEFYWDDLTPQKQQEILDVFGDNGNWDIFPFFTLQIDESEEE